MFRPCESIGGDYFNVFSRAKMVDVQTRELQSGDRIYLYSDGITERRNPSGDFFGEKALPTAMESKKQAVLQQSVDEVTTHNDAFGAPLAAQDDLNLVGLDVVNDHDNWFSRQSIHVSSLQSVYES